MNTLAPIETGNPLVPTTFDDAIRLAKAMASAGLVPEHLRGDVGSCLLIVEQALRWRMSPFAVAQCTSSIHGKLMFEGKLVMAAVKSMGAITGNFEFAWSGEGDARQVIVSATRSGENQPKTITAVLKDVRTDQKVWKTQADQQLAYAGSRIWARRWTPEALLGVYAPEEFDRTTGQLGDDAGGDGTPAAPRPRTGPTIDAKAEKTATTDPPADPPKKQTMRQWLDDFVKRCEAANTEEIANSIMKEEGSLRLDDPDTIINADARRRALKARNDMVARVFPRDPPDDDLVINGEDKVAAG